LKEYLLGIDVGTTGAKVLLIDDRGRVADCVVGEYPVHMPRPLWTEQNPSDWWRAARWGIVGILDRSGIKPRQIAAVGLTGQMHGLVPMDRRGKVIRPCILWNDQRTIRQCQTILRRIGPKRILELTGNTVLPGFTLPKILWIRDQEPNAYERIAKIALPKDYIRLMMTGVVASDVADASGTALFDVGRRRWSDEMIRTLNIPRAWMPTVTESTVVSSRINQAGSRATGLLVGTPVIAGAGDQAAQAIGTGIIDEPSTSVTIGTSGVVFAASRTFRAEASGRLHAFCHAVPDRWHLMGVMLSAGGSLRWLRDILFPSGSPADNRRKTDIYDLMTRQASRVEPGSEGLIFLPYLAGERTPYVDPDARGVFFGLSLRHRSSHLIRSVMEGVTFGLLDSLNLLRRSGIRARRVRISGGGGRSDFWRQMISDIFGLATETVKITEGAAYGSAILAGVGCGIYPDVTAAVDRVIKVRAIHRPGIESRFYKDYYRRYRSLYSSLAAEFKELTEVVDKRGEVKDNQKTGR